MNVTIETSQDQMLIEQLLQEQPDSRLLLERLLSRYEGKTRCGAFALIEGHRCGACHLLITAVRLAHAREQKFVTCANCSRFLHYPAAEPKLLPPAA